ncbi:MAG: tetratricopeptide repeat protein [Cytophagales bacterium]
MNYNMKSLSIVLGISALTFTGCSLKQMVKMAKDQNLTVNPSPLEVHADTVKSEVSVLLPVKMLKKNKIYSVKTWYQAGDKKIDLGELELKQNPDYPKAKTESPKLSKTFTFPYSENLNKGELKVQGFAYNMTKSKSRNTDEMSIAKGLITTSKLVQDIYVASYATHGYNNQEELRPTRVEFFFEKGKSNLRKTEQTGRNGKFFESFIAAKNVTRVVTITGSHSPEGTETINGKLSDDRAKSIEKHYRENMKKFKYNQGTQDSIKFVLKAVVKDWTAFKDTLALEPRISQQEKDEILAIVNGGVGDFVEKEKQLQRLKSYKAVVKHVYPKLRIARTEILTVKPKKSDAQISILAKGIYDGTVKADTLTSEELLYSATLSPELPEKEKIYISSTKKSDDWKSYNNLGATYLEMAIRNPNASQRLALADKAITALEQSIKKQESDLAFLNLATAYLMKGDKVKSVENIQNVLNKSNDADAKKGANSLMAVWLIKAGKYDDAVTYLQNGVSENVNVKYDLALALLLKKDLDKAKVAFDEATTANPNDALAYYCSAITAARLNSVEIMAARLKKAIQLNSELRAKALEDLEFMNFWSNDQFKDAVK